MKVYFNRRPVDGPWGGGSKILKTIVQECIKRGHEVYYEEHIFKQSDLNVLVCFDPREKDGVGYGHLLSYRNSKKIKLVQRVGDLGTHGKPELLELVKKTSEHSDLLIFPSHWAKNYLEKTPGESKVIANAPLKVFQDNKKLRTAGDDVRLVSHHWSNNSMKGFEVYKSLDEMDGISFKFIGRKPDDVSLKNHVPPQDINGIIREMEDRNVYVTASKKEAGANHVLEAMALGLPVLYHRDGGSISEYCKDHGIEYQNFEDLEDIIRNQKTRLNEISKNQYLRSTDEMAREYVDEIERVT